MAFTESTNGGRPLKGGVVQLGNFTGLQAATFGVTSTLLFLTIGSVVLRFWSRRIKKIRIMANDIFAAAALVSFAVAQALSQLLTLCSFPCLVSSRLLSMVSISLCCQQFRKS